MSEGAETPLWPGWLRLMVFAALVLVAALAAVFAYDMGYTAGQRAAQAERNGF